MLMLFLVNHVLYLEYCNINCLFQSLSCFIREVCKSLKLNYIGYFGKSNLSLQIIIQKIIKKIIINYAPCTDTYLLQ